jgi:hypothetical protein
VEGIVDLTGGASSSISGSAAAIHPDSFFGLSIIEGAKKYLKMVRRAQHTSAIADALARGGLKRPQESTLSSLLVRAAKGREVMKVGKAMWGLAEWYPKAPKDDNGEVPQNVSKPGRKRGRPTTASKRAAPARPEPTNGAGVSEMTRDVLRASGKPLHVREITGQVNARGNPATKATISSLLAVWVKKGRVKRTAPGTFSLS